MYDCNIRMSRSPNAQQLRLLKISCFNKCNPFSERFGCTNRNPNLIEWPKLFGSKLLDWSFPLRTNSFIIVVVVIVHIRIQSLVAKKKNNFQTHIIIIMNEWRNSSSFPFSCRKQYTFQFCSIGSEHERRIVRNQSSPTQRPEVMKHHGLVNTWWANVSRTNAKTYNSSFNSTTRFTFSFFFRLGEFLI